MTTQEAIEKAYKISDSISVCGIAIEQMASLRAALREAYAAAKQDQSEEDDGK